MNVWLIQCNPFQEMLYILGVFNLWSSLMGQRKMTTYPCRRLTVSILCLDSTLLRQLKNGKKDKKAINSGSSLGISSLSGGTRAQRICHCSHSVQIPILLGNSAGHRCPSSVCDSEQHRMLICQMVVWHSIQTEVSVGQLPAYSVIQGAS